MRSAKASTFRVGVAAVCLLAALTTGCSRDPNVRKQKYLESGQRYFDKGQYREAEIQFQNAIQVDSRFAEAHYKLAQAAIKLGDGQTVYHELSQTVEIQPDNYAAHLDLANLLVAARQFNEAKDHLDILAQKQPNADFYIARANYYAATSDVTDALADMRKAIDLDPKRSDAFLNLGLLQIHGEQWDAAEASFKQAAKLDPKSIDAQLYLGKFYQTRGRFPEAEQWFKKAIETAPNDPNPRLSLAGLYVAENKPEQAEEFLRQSKKDFPNNSEGYRMLGDYYYHNGDIDKATAEYEVLYRDHDKDAVVKKNFIQLLILKNRLDEARKLNDENLKAKPDDEDSLVFKGNIEIRSGKASDAVNTLQAVIKNNPDHAVAHYQLGLAYDQLGNTNRAESEWHEAVRLGPGNVEAHRALAGVAIHHSDAAALAQEASQIIELQPAAPDGYLLRGVAETDRKQFATADEDFRRSLERQPNNPAAYVQLGNLHVAQGQNAEAQKFYQQALDQDPNNTDAMGGVLNVDLLQKQPDKAIATVRAQLDKYPKNLGFHIMLGQLLVEQKKDLAAGEAEFQRASDLDKKNDEARIKLGVVQTQRGAVDQALQTYLEGSKNNPNDVVFYVLAGDIYRNRGQWDLANQQYNKVLAIQPDNPVASNDLAYVMLQQGGNVDIAFGLAQKARRQLPDNPNSADTLGWAFYHKKVYSSAIDLFKEAVKKDPGNPVFNLHLGLAYAKNGQLNLGQQQLDHVLKLNPNQPGIDELRQALVELKG